MNGGNSMNIRGSDKKRLKLFLLIVCLIGVMNFYPFVSSMAEDTSIVGCATQADKGYDVGFKTEDFSFINVGVDANKKIKLNTGNQALDINNIVVPFDQEVAVTFVYENAGYTYTRFGWMFATDVLSTGLPNTAKIRWVYSDINDNNANGILDVSGSTNTNKWNDRNNDGKIDARDNKEVLGYFKGGTELVFVLDSSPNNGKYTSSENRGATLYTKKAWNPPASQNPGGIQRLVQFYTDSSTQSANSKCEQYARTDPTYGCLAGCTGTGNHAYNTQGWLDAAARTRLRTVFGLNFDAVVTGNTKCIDDLPDAPSQAMIVAAPAQNPNAWIIAGDDQRDRKSVV
jgi:type IV pilus assembly protein PilY1